MKASLFIGVLCVGIFIAAIVGEVKCVLKMIDCNWQPVGKAEVIYTVGTFTGIGCIVGYIDIQDK